MNGYGILKGLWVTFRHFIKTYIEDIKRGRKFYRSAEGIDARREADVEGIFSIQYPEEKLPVPEEFRFLPFLVYDEGPDGERKSAAQLAAYAPRHVHHSASGLCGVLIRQLENQWQFPPSITSMWIFA
ncbi:MAG TPA: hypothetical protein PKV95_11975 [Anaerolineaceae bacterium]|nr:hypothetical protein [Anaerolineaceae bacterium]